MQQRFLAHVQKNFPEIISGKSLLAISGGIDSVVLAHLLKKSQLDFALAHCNFSLRGKESDTDAVFVKNLAKALDVEVFTKNFDTQKFASDYQLNTQLAARELRYAWFEELLDKEKYDFLLTAHHANDNAETFFINFMRGSGLKGLTGIPIQNQQIRRPLLVFTKEEIETFAKANNLSWREDSSNKSDKYVRNQIRHHVIPQLEKINESWLESFQKSQEYLQQSQDLIDDYLSIVFSKAVKKEGELYKISILQLKEMPNPKAILYQLLNEFGFTEWNDVYHLMEAQTGKAVYSKTHQLLKNRDELLLSTRENNHESEYLIHQGEDFVLGNEKIVQENVNILKDVDKFRAYFPEEKLRFPLTLRKWKLGDFFYPFGMQGKKKISDFFTDQKVSKIEKEKIWLLCNGEDVIWVVGYRTDNRYRITENTQEIIKFTYEK
ncbi:tRNA lysidine(34) synthetase TilS [Mesonia sp. K7]|uniref:tRNA lysidine(34) synthetase TilS n=1 Tax=Mesonia sp. K7 TaxID=2218606 RepID=UPI000DA9330A|nr:tRNA lysidine(34) synthetase TilS [Mesonia sp. K7]PZD76925.1 tRNA lysidine(34) synthetase TilS [Mesonia sp. K7]